MTEPGASVYSSCSSFRSKNVAPAVLDTQVCTGQGRGVGRPGRVREPRWGAAGRCTGRDYRDAAAPRLGNRARGRAGGQGGRGRRAGGRAGCRAGGRQACARGAHLSNPASTFAGKRQRTRRSNHRRVAMTSIARRLMAGRRSGRSDSRGHVDRSFWNPRGRSSGGGSAFGVGRSCAICRLVYLGEGSSAMVGALQGGLAPVAAGPQSAARPRSAWLVCHTPPVERGECTPSGSRPCRSSNLQPYTRASLPHR